MAALPVCCWKVRLLLGLVLAAGVAGVAGVQQLRLVRAALVLRPAALLLHSVASCCAHAAQCCLLLRSCCAASLPPYLTVMLPDHMVGGLNLLDPVAPSAG